MIDQPRIPPLAKSERGEAANELLAMVGDLDRLNIFATMVRHPQLFKRWVPFGAVLLVQGSLPSRDRELLILRTAHRCSCTYEWRHHEEIAAVVGLTGEEISAVREDPGWTGWSTFDRTLLQAADELHDDQAISDSTWSTLASRYDQAQLIEVPMLVGQYHGTAFTLNSLGIQLEDEYR
jgi:4-carboxymuconolactone decarboxylase